MAMLDSPTLLDEELVSARDRDQVPHFMYISWLVSSPDR